MPPPPRPPARPAAPRTASCRASLGFSTRLCLGCKELCIETSIVVNTITQRLHDSLRKRDGAIGNHQQAQSGHGGPKDPLCVMAAPISCQNFGVLVVLEAQESGMHRCSCNVCDSHPPRPRQSHWAQELAYCAAASGWGCEPVGCDATLYQQTKSDCSDLRTLGSYCRAPWPQYHL